MTNVYINHIATSIPDYDVHRKFIDYVPFLLKDECKLNAFKRMESRSGIEHRYSFLEPHSDKTRLDANNFYVQGHFPDTQVRMSFYEHHAFFLACRALDQLDIKKINQDITHLIVTSCTGFYAPGIDLQVALHYGLNPSVERTIIGFMGCYAAINALKSAYHIVRSKKKAKIIILNLELCTLHLNETDNLDQALSFLIFGDGCAATLVSADPRGIELTNFKCAVVPETTNQITWHIRNLGFEMFLSGKIPSTIADKLPSFMSDLLMEVPLEAIAHWAIHPGGRSILDAVQKSLGLGEKSLSISRDILRRFGNMSSATIMFVLKEMMNNSLKGQGCGLAFGPGLTIESMLFNIEGQ